MVLMLINRTSIAAKFTFNSWGYNKQFEYFKMSEYAYFLSSLNILSLHQIYT